MSGLDIAIAVVCSAFLLMAYFLFRSHRSYARIVNVRRLYIQNIARIETIVVQVNQLQNLAAHIHEGPSFRYYEDMVQMLEALMVALSRIPPLSDKGELVRSMEPMITDLEGRVVTCREKFKKDLAPRKELSQLFQTVHPNAESIKGCYFCSKPYSPKNFRRVSIRFQGDRMQVYGCANCRAELKSRRSVDILHFVHEDRTVHWSQLPGYDPRKDFWTLGALRTERIRPQLELVSESELDD